MKRKIKSQIYIAGSASIASFIFFVFDYVTDKAVFARVVGDGSFAAALPHGGIFSISFFVLIFSALRFGGHMEYDGNITLSAYFFWAVIGGIVCFIAGLLFGFSENFSSPVTVGAAAFCLWVGLVACCSKAKDMWERRQRVNSTSTKTKGSGTDKEQREC